MFRHLRSRLAQERLRSLQAAARQAAAEVRRAADQVRALADSTYAGSRSGQLAQELDAVAGGLVQLADDLGRPFLLFVVGMGKFGKSTLINALLGQRVAAMDALPKTWKIDVFTHTLPEGVAEVRTYQGHVERLSVDEAVRLIAEEEWRRDQSEEKVWQLFRERARKLTSVTEKEILRRELETLYLYRSPIVEVKWPVPPGGIAAHFDVVDTPGLWQERPERQRLPESAATDSQPFSLVSSEDLRSYYLQADGVLWMLDATKLAAGKPHELMSDLNSALNRVGGVARNAVAVLNRIDLVRRNGGEEAVVRVVQQAHSLLSGLFRHVIPISAREALEAREAGDEERLRRSGLPDLLAVIDQEFRVGGADIRWWSKLEGRYQYLRQVQTVSQRYRQELSEAEVSLQKRATDARRHLVALKRKAEQRFSEALVQYESEVIARLPELIPELLKLGEAARSEYLRDNVYQLRRLKTLFETLLQDVQKEYLDTISELIPLQRFTAFRYADPPPLPLPVARFSARPNLVEVDVEAGDPSKTAGFLIASLTSLLAASALGPLGLLVGPLVSSTLFGDYLTSLRVNQVEQNLRKQLSVVSQAAREQWQRAIQELARESEQRLTEVRERSFAQIHVPVSKVPAVRKALDTLEIVASRTLPQPDARQLTLIPWIREHCARQAAD